MELKQSQVGGNYPSGKVKWILSDGSPSSEGMTGIRELFVNMESVLAGDVKSIASVPFRDPESSGPKSTRTCVKSS